MNDVINGYIELAERTLSEKRATHSKNVANMCVKLATIHGGDIDTAYTAGILHDIRKETPQDIIKNETAISGFEPDEIERITPQLWHAVSGAWFVKNNLNIINNDIINAIRFHTIGRAGMSLLEKIVYMGDLVSDDRKYPDVDKFREYALDNLDNAMYHSVKWSIQNTMSKLGKIPHYTFEAYNYFMDFRK